MKNPPETFTRLRAAICEEMALDVDPDLYAELVEQVVLRARATHPRPGNRPSAAASTSLSATAAPREGGL